MSNYFTLLLFIGLAYSQETEKEDSTFFSLKSGEIKQVQKSHAHIEFANPLSMYFEITDKDSMKYDIEDIQNIKDSKGNIVIGEKTIFLLRFVESTFEFLVLIGLGYCLLI